MKKIIATTLALALAASLLTGCGSKPETKPAETAPAETKPAETEQQSEGMKLGLGHDISIAKSVDATADKNGQAQVNTVMAAVTVDADGKIADVRIDNAQVKVDFDAAGKIVTDKTVAPKTKVELGPEYGMLPASQIKKEWFEQAAALEDWMKGKTIDEIKAMKTYKRDEEHTAVPDEEDLKTSVTISVEDYIAAVEEAVKNAAPVSGNVAKLGLGHDVSIEKSVDATADKNGQAQVNTVISATVFDADGKILDAKIDNAQVKVDFDATGKIATDKTVAPKTKVELGPEYGMLAASQIKKEWFEQAAALEDWMVGKTVDEVKAIKTFKRDEEHTAVPDEEDLKTSVTMSVEDYIAATAEAFENAK